MMTRLRTLRDETGSAAIEFAIAVPVLAVMIWGMFQIAIVLQANAGMQQALGEGARYATIFDTDTNARPTDDEIAAKITSAKFGVGGGTWHTPSIDDSNEASDGYIVIDVSYDVPTNFLLFPGPTITLEHSKRVYTQTA
ncbi:MAG TPA: TadE/TadG family type IV pilus assembly protein [Sphingomicrobium sp.]|jgi:Flp pilus assembly protein TadG|nr:TadE/TadG family type IV pilus assembly protein [Sphingomicrobium sp.]